MINVVIPTAPALPANAPVVYKMYDWSDASNPVLTSQIKLNRQEADFVPEGEELAAERGAAAWHRSTDMLVLGDFKFGVHLFVSHAGNTTSGTQPLMENIIGIQKGGEWTTYPFSATYNKKRDSVFPRPFKIVSEDAAGNVVHVFEMRDGLPINDKSLYQGSPLWEAGRTNRPKVCAGMTLPWWNERPRRSTVMQHLFAGITEEGMRPSAAKSHFSVLGCEPQLTGGYSGNSLNSLANIWVNKEWPMPKAGYWPEAGKGDPWFNYNDTCMDGRSAFMGPWIQGYRFEHGSRTTHNWYCAPGGPRFDRAFVPSQMALFMTDAFGKRPDGVSYSEIAYGFALAYNNHPNKFMTDASRLFLRPDEDLLESRLYFTGNYYGDGGQDGENAIRLNANQRDGTNDSHFDNDVHMPFHGWGRDTLHNYATAANAAFALQSPMMMVLAKFDAITSFMSHGSPDHSGRGNDFGGGNYLVRDMAWDWLHHAMGWTIGANHALGFSRKQIMDRFCRKLEAIHRDIVVPIQTGNYPEGFKFYFEGIARFGQPLSKGGRGWQMHGGGLAFYLTGPLVYMKQSGMYAEIQARGGKAYEALLFTIRNAMQYAFGIFSQTKATMFSNPSFYADYKFADGTPIPADWAEFSAVMEPTAATFNTNEDGSLRSGDRDVSVHPVIQFVYAMRDYYPEIDHQWKADAIAKVDNYLKKQTDRVKALEGQPEKQRDADHIYRYPGVAPLKAPAVVGPGETVVLPVVPVRPMTQVVKEEVKVENVVTAPPPVGEGDWVFVGKEGAWLTVDAGLTMRYGSGTKIVYKVSDGKAFSASNGYFGSDPAPGITKDVHKFIPKPVPVPEPAEEAPQATPQNPVEPEPMPVPPVVETPPEAPVEVVEVVLLPDYNKAYEAAAKAFLEALGYIVTK